MYNKVIKHWKLLTVASVILSFALAVWFGSRQSVWFDEAYSISLIQESYSRLLHLTSIDAHPPLYYLSLKVWSTAFGESEAALRSFSAICGSLAVAFSALIARRLFSAKVAVATLPFVVFAPFLVRYNFEIRMYALASLIGVAATYVLVCATQNQNKAKGMKLWILYAVLVALGMYTLYFTAFLWITHFAWLLLRWFKSRERRSLLSQPWVRAFFLSIVLYIPWLPTFFYQLFHPVGSGVAAAIDYRHMFGVFSFGLRYEAVWQLEAWGSFLIALSIVGIIYMVSKAYSSLGKAQKKSYLLIIGYLLVPFILLTILSLPPLSPRYLERYISHIIIGGYILIGVSAGILLTSKTKKWTLVISGFLLGMMIFGLYRLYNTGNYVFERLLEPRAEQTASRIDCQPGDIVLAGEPMLYYELHYYLPNCEYRFYNFYGEMSERGGFASLYRSQMQVRDGDILNAPRIFYVYLDEEPFVKLPNYRLENFSQTGKYRLGTYIRIN